MRKKWRGFVDQYGYYALVTLCLAVVLFSALMTRRADTARSTPSTVSQDETLSDVRYVMETDAPAPEGWISPVEGADVVRAYSQTPVYFEALRVWRAHRAIDYAAPKGAQVRAMKSDRVQEIGDVSVTVLHADGSTAVYTGLADIAVKAGDTLAQGSALGLSAGEVTGEGAGFLHVAVFSAGEAINFAEE